MAWVVTDCMRIISSELLNPTRQTHRLEVSRAQFDVSVTCGGDGVFCNVFIPVLASLRFACEPWLAPETSRCLPSNSTLQVVIVICFSDFHVFRSVDTDQLSVDGSIAATEWLNLRGKNGKIDMGFRRNLRFDRHVSYPPLLYIRYHRLK